MAPKEKELEEKVSLIEEALTEFAYSECPYCQSYVGPDKYIDQEDIRKWLVKRLK